MTAGRDKENYRRFDNYKLQINVKTLINTYGILMNRSYCFNLLRIKLGVLDAARIVAAEAHLLRPDIFVREKTLSCSFS